MVIIIYIFIKYHLKYHYSDIKLKHNNAEIK